ncbi:Prefoldin subunit 6, partial [Linum grandiflorum]
LSADIAKNHQVRKKYTIQLGENELVLKELELLREDANVFKLIGPVLVKQDLAEANANVRKRIEYISAELKRHDATLQDLEEKQNSKREAVRATLLHSYVLSIISLADTFSQQICFSLSYQFSLSFLHL